MNILKVLKQRKARQVQLAKYAELMDNGDVMGILEILKNEPLAYHAKWYINHLRNSESIKMVFDGKTTTVTMEAK